MTAPLHPLVKEIAKAIRQAPTVDPNLTWDRILSRDAILTLARSLADAPEVGWVILGLREQNKNLRAEVAALRAEADA